MLNLWNCEKLSFECLFLVRLAIVAALSILVGALSCFFIYLIVWFLSSAFGWVLIPISFAFFVYYVMENIRNQI
ncbi:hypothetical protein EIP73_11440 [Xylella fastidiosa subsp. pauca]|nr:hypothetical protein EIP73_11440 [Xylella fastidiosa subsp. pauca]TNW25956.1 hypothetical protein EIP74_06080 [Xylella fastidiosa subsp. pauca]